MHRAEQDTVPDRRSADSDARRAHCGARPAFFREKVGQLIAWGESEIALLRHPQGSDRSTKEHLIAIWQATGEQPEELANQPECPDEIRYLWDWFWQVAANFSFTELSHWSQLTRRNLRAWEVDVLFELSRVWK